MQYKQTQFTFIANKIDCKSMTKIIKINLYRNLMTGTGSIKINGITEKMDDIGGWTKHIIDYMNNHKLESKTDLKTMFEKMFK